MHDYSCAVCQTRPSLPSTIRALQGRDGAGLVALHRVCRRAGHRSPAENRARRARDRPALAGVPSGDLPSPVQQERHPVGRYYPIVRISGGEVDRGAACFAPDSHFWTKSDPLSDRGLNSVVASPSPAVSSNATSYRLIGVVFDANR